MSKKLNGGNFGMTIGSNRVVVVYFWATWCEPCAKYSEIYESVCSKIEIGTAVMGKFDLDESKDVAISAGVKGVPCIQIYNNGNKVNELVGIKKPTEILSAIRAIIKQ